MRAALQTHRREPSGARGAARRRLPELCMAVCMGAESGAEEGEPSLVAGRA
jgi:hypothetical protein